ncbi:alpha/beta hydrolase [Dietzia sp. SLG310A2-38A2]|uniref:alpha/beta hydrolase n=1 Tax=Dietzia sp. SLG310A2-38A2 TaxID=1630643 RepID=UPI0015FDDE30|nr:alpha/beta hydrolase [Dietzia sp. SLG310A2-38A2]MBB1032618.1 alpha/beta hydrolase [Dietzia sp. SLG310A2-38A2]
MPDSVVTPLQKAGINSSVLKQVYNYMSEEGLRAAVLTQILKTLPESGEIVLIGHSLGSIIAIDLIDHLPEKLHVSRFITIGSPGSAQILHEKHERLLKRFPYARVDDWTNFFVPMDPVTAGRGLASVFPGAQDFRIQIPFAKNNPFAHGAEQYLAHPAVGMLVADALRPPEDVPSTGTEIAIRIDDTESDALFTISYGLRVASKIGKKDTAARYEDTLRVLSDEFVDGVRQRLPQGSSLPVEVEALAQWQLPEFPQRLELDDAVRRVVMVSFTNIIQPFEIEIGDAQTEAIPEFFVDLGYTSGDGRRVRDAITDVRKVLARSGGFPAGRLALAAAGLALIAAGPIGIATMGTAAGAAAITSGLAAFGPGGMAGGLALLSGLASTGAMVTTAAATLKGGDDGVVSDPASLAIRVASSHALKLVGEQPDPHLWSSLTFAEGTVASHINKLTEFSDPKSEQLMQLVQTRDTINRLMEFANDNGLGMKAVN